MLFIANNKTLFHFISGQSFDGDLQRYKKSKSPKLKPLDKKGIGPYFYYVLDWHKIEVNWISEGWRAILDYDERFWSRGTNKKADIIYPSDRDPIHQVLLKWMDFTRNKTEEEINKYSVSFNYRILRQDGKVLNILHQILYTSVDRFGNIIYDLGMVTDISHLTNNEKCSLNIVGPNGKDKLTFCPINSFNTTIPKASIQIRKLDEITIQNSFISKTRDIIKKHIHINDFNVSDLSDHLCLSRTQLYRKLVSVSGISPNNLIKLERLNEAAKLLSETELSMSEIAYQVGFGSPCYFTKSFKKEFDYTPKKYKTILKYKQ